MLQNPLLLRLATILAKDFSVVWIRNRVLDYDSRKTQQQMLDARAQVKDQIQRTLVLTKAAVNIKCGILRVNKNFTRLRLVSIILYPSIKGPAKFEYREQSFCDIAYTVGSLALSFI